MMYPNKKFLNLLQHLQGLRVLLVDSNDDFCYMITMLLQIYGVEVLTASLSQQALEIFVQWQPDVIVSDIALPYEDGCELIQQVRTKAGERGEVVLAIAVTGYGNQEMFHEHLCVGFDLWFTKPLDLDEFVTVLACLAICKHSTDTIAQRILDHVPKHTNRLLHRTRSGS